jgi:uncharacterized protein YciI
MDLEAYELVFLRRPASAPALDEPALERLQREHVAFYDRLRTEGTVVTNGPVLDQPDQSFRGIGIYRTGSLEEARRVAEQDPLVLAGRLAIDVVTWWARPGTMVSPGRAISIPDP